MILFLYSGYYDDVIPDRKPKSVDEEIDAAVSNMDSPEWVRDGADHDYSPQGRQDRLMIHVNVYILADMLNIEDLKKYSDLSFAISSSGSWPHHDFPQIIGTLFSSIIKADDEFHEDSIRICHKHSEELMKDEKFVEVMSQHGDLGVGMMRLAAQDLKRLKTNKVEVTRDLVAAGRQIASLKEGVLDLELAFETMTSKLRS